MRQAQWIVWLMMVGAFCPLNAREKSKGADLSHVFAPLPAAGVTQTPCVPSPNPHLYAENAAGFAARTVTNEDYGMPGWTRSLGSRFHKGVDILPIEVELCKQTVQIEYTDRKTGRTFSRNEPVKVPKDEIYAILDGVVVVANADEKRSGYGCYVTLEHHFADGKPFISMSAHLDRLEVAVGDAVHKGQRIGWMGRTSSSSGGRTYLKAIPHCHFEVGCVIDPDFPSKPAARALNPRLLGGKYDPRNIQPYQPVQFLREYHAEVRSAATLTRSASPAKAE